MNNNLKKLEQIRHSCAHLLAAAVLELWPGTKNAIGPSIENGFYQDFDFGKIKISEEDFPKIEQKMHRIVSSWEKFAVKEVSIQQARRDFKHNPYKLTLIEEFQQQGKTITENNPGNFLDLCKGGHASDPKNELKHFKLLSVAGAYWKGSEKNKMLTRIYGTLFPTKEELDKYLWQIEEVKKRDHKKIGQELDLFSFHDEGRGFVFWHPNGMRFRQPLIDFWQELHCKADYEEVSTPILLSDTLWKKSGHWKHYKKHMYFTKVDKQTYALKPMNCPGTILIYQNKQRSYRDLPIRWRELGLVHRHEPSGTLNGLFRERAFRQDDAHIFCAESQMEKEIKDIVKLALSMYDIFHFETIQIELSTRPEKSIGSDAMWNKAEDILKKVLLDLKLPYKLNKQDGAFYGPKIDFHLKDSLGRLWQCGTVQLDFAMPELFDLTYIDATGQKKHPVMIHRTIFGSVHRFFAIIIEHYAGKFPLWLAPTQVMVMPITDKQESFAKKIVEDLKKEGIRAELDSRQETLQAKIRDGSLQKIPYLGIIGDKEVQSSSRFNRDKVQNLSVRTREGKNLGQIELCDFLHKLKEEIDKKI